MSRLSEARRADTRGPWSQHKRKLNGLDLVFSPHKSVSLAAEFAATPAESAAMWNAVDRASDRAMRYVAHVLGWARNGASGEDGRRSRRGWLDQFPPPHGAADAGDPGSAARPNCSTLRSPATRTCTSIILDESCRHRGRACWVAGLEGTDRCPLEGIRRLLPGSAGRRAAAAGRPHRLRRGRANGGRLAIPSTTVRRSARRAGRSSTRRRPTPKTRASTGRLGGRRQDGHPAGRRCRGRLGKMKPEERNIWREQAAALGWHHRMAMEGVVHERLSDGERFARRDDQGERRASIKVRMGLAVAVGGIWSRFSRQ
jgi:hypothetical protein